jgi:hypothetical protein
MGLFKLSNDILFIILQLLVPEVLGSIPGASRFSEKQRVWNEVHSASGGQLRSYLEEN